MRIQRRVPCWAIIHPAEDLPGVWVGHCLDLDVVSQANSPEQALRMVQDASAMTLQDDLERGAEPTARRAPEELWQLLSRIQHEGQQVHGIREAARAIKEEGDPLVMIAAQFTLHIEEQTMLEPVQDAPLFLLSNVEQRAC